MLKEKDLRIFVAITEKSYFFKMLWFDFTRLFFLCVGIFAYILYGWYWLVQNVSKFFYILKNLNFIQRKWGYTLRHTTSYISVLDIGQTEIKWIRVASLSIQTKLYNLTFIDSYLKISKYITREITQNHKHFKKALDKF